MADVTMWQDNKARAAFEAKGKALLKGLLPKLEGQTGVVAIEPESGDYFVGATLGKADAAAFAKYPTSGSTLYDWITQRRRSRWPPGEGNPEADRAVALRFMTRNL